MTTLRPDELIARVRAALGRAAECQHDHSSVDLAARLVERCALAVALRDVALAAQRVGIATPTASAETVRALVDVAALALSLASRIEVQDGA